MSGRATGVLPEGVVVPLVTPRDAGGEVDGEVFRRLVRILTDRGAAAHFVAGGQGQGWLLDDDAVSRLVGIACAETGQGIPVLCGVSASSTAVALHRARIAARAGAAVVVATPPLATVTDDRSLRTFFLALAEESPVPVVLYNHPARTGRMIPVPLVGELGGHENVVGVKDSGGALPYLIDVLAHRMPGFRVFAGHDSLALAGLALGCDGVVASTANLVPELHVALFEAVRRGDLVEARRLQTGIHRLRSFDVPALVAVVQQGLGVLGLDAGRPEAPSATIDEKRLPDLAALLAEIGARPLVAGVAP